MSDLISREAMLKHIEKIRQSVQMMDDTHRASIIMNGMYLCEEAVWDQPSAQPEIIRCGQCKYAEVADKEDAQDGYTCQFHRGSVWFSGSYCSWAERRPDGFDRKTNGD